MLNYVLSVIVVVSCFIPTFACMFAGVAPSSMTAFFAGLWLVVGLVVSLFAASLSGRALRRVAAAVLVAALLFSGTCVLGASVPSAQVPVQGTVVVYDDTVSTPMGSCGVFAVAVYDASGCLIERAFDEVDEGTVVRSDGSACSLARKYEARGFVLRSGRLTQWW